MKAKFLILNLGVFVFYIAANAQTTDSIKLIKEFIAIGKKYQFPPVQVDVLYKKYSNSFISKDTVDSEAKFVVKNSTNAYINWGNFEQIVSDSVVVVVLKDAKRLVIYSGSKEQMQKKMQTLGFINYPDSAYRQLLATYTVKETEFKNTSVKAIILESKQYLYKTNIIKDAVILKYNILTKEPVEIKVTKRHLKKLEDENANLIDKNKYQVINIENKGTFWVYEENQSFTFKSIQHLPNIELPYKITDRIIISPNRQIKPVKEFENFTLTTH